MHTNTVRTHVLLPENLVKEIDALVGPRQRSQFFINAAEEKVKRLRLKKIAHKAAGSLSHVAIPEWESSQKAADWVHNSRRVEILNDE